ncbi:unnamed protein product [Sympodiomycopsis kandeliae]
MAATSSMTETNGHAKSLYDQYASSSSSSSSSSHLASRLSEYLGPLSESQVQSNLLSRNPILSSALPSSSVFSTQIEELKKRLEQDSARVEQSHAHVLTELKSSQSQLQNVRSQIDALPSEIEHVEDRLEDISKKSDSSNSNTLTSKLTRQHDAITSLTSARDYFSILGRAQSLWEKCLKDQTDVIGKDSHTVADAQLEHLTELAHLVNYTETLSDSAASLRLLPFLKSKVAETYRQLVKMRSDALRQALTQAEWPPLTAEQAEAQGKPVRSAASVLGHSQVRLRWTALTSLQIVGSKLRLTAIPSCLDRACTSRPGSQDYAPLYTTESIAEPYLLRFRFHFDSSRSTNRLDKPEWYLNHILGLFRTLSPWFAVQGPVVKLSRTATQRYGEVFNSTPETDILGVLLKPVQAKLKSSIPLLVAQQSQVKDDSRIMAHTVSELIRFDDELDDQLPSTFISSEEVFARSGPVRLSEEILNNQEWFDAWLQGERDSAFENLERILDDGDAWTIGATHSDGIDDEEESDPRVGSWAAAAAAANSPSKDGKTTRSARSIVTELQNLTTTYTPLPTLSQRLRFVTEIQLPILRMYQERLTRSLEAFESLSSAFMRAIPGGIEPGSGSHSNSGGGGGDPDMVKGLRGLSRLLKAFLSAWYIHQELQKWSEQSIFLEMSHDLLSTDQGKQLLQRQRDEAELKQLDGESLGSLIRKVGFSNARSTSASGASAGNLSTSSGGESIWDEPISKYSAIMTRASDGIKKLVVSEVSDSLRSYTQQSWLDDDDDDGDAEEEKEVSITPILLPSLTILHTHLTHFLPILPKLTSIGIYKSISSEISSFLVQKVVILGGSKRFTLSGSQRFLRDWSHGWKGVLEQVSSSLKVKGAMGYDITIPWNYLQDTSLLLTVDQNTLSEVVNILFEQDEVIWQSVRRQLGISRSLQREKAKEIVRRRIESPR